jgi:hypothetical protein
VWPLKRGSSTSHNPGDFAREDEDEDEDKDNVDASHYCYAFVCSVNAPSAREWLGGVLYMADCFDTTTRISRGAMTLEHHIRRQQPIDEEFLAGENKANVLGQTSLIIVLLLSVLWASVSIFRRDFLRRASWF